MTGKAPEDPCAPPVGERLSRSGGDRLGRAERRSGRTRTARLSVADTSPSLFEDSEEEGDKGNQSLRRIGVVA